MATTQTNPSTTEISNRERMFEMDVLRGKLLNTLGHIKVLVEENAYEYFDFTAPPKKTSVETYLKHRAFSQVSANLMTEVQTDMAALSEHIDALFKALV